MSREEKGMSQEEKGVSRREKDRKEGGDQGRRKAGKIDKRGNRMEEKRFFQDALAGFTYEAACGGAIRHLADLGYTVRQIAGQLDYPVPYEKVRRAVWQRLVDTEVILLEEPGSAPHRERAVYVREYDQFGRASFRRVAEDGPGGFRGGKTAAPGNHGKEALPGSRPEGIAGAMSRGGKSGEWKEGRIGGGPLSAGEPANTLYARTEVNGKDASYVSCDFGLTAEKAPEVFRRLLEALEERQRDYVEGLPWEKRRVYHRLDPRMTQILLRLYGRDCWHGACYFLNTRERILF